MADPRDQCPDCGDEDHHGCDPDSVAVVTSGRPEELIAALRHRVTELEAEVEELKVRDIVSRNPGIDIDEVRAIRAKRASLLGPTR